MKRMFNKLLAIALGASVFLSANALADWFTASGIPVQRSAISSAEFRTEFSNIETLISDKLPAYTGNGDKIVVVNAGGTALTSITSAAAATLLGLPTHAGVEVITGQWTFEARVDLDNGTALRFYDSTDTDFAAFSHDDTDFNTAFTTTTDWNITGITALSAGTVDADFDAITGTSYGGILEANLLDKSAAETVAGAYAFSAAIDLQGNVSDSVGTFTIDDALSVTGLTTFDTTLTVTAAAHLESTAPALYLLETDAAADNGLWRWLASAEQLSLETRTDADGAGADILTVDRTGTVVDTVNIAATTFQTNGAEATHATGSFTVAFESACTVTPSDTWYWARAGDLVTIVPTQDDLSCTSDTVAFDAGTDLPAAIRPARTVKLHTPIRDGGVQGVGCLVLTAAGGITVSRNTSGAGCAAVFSASGLKAVTTYAWTYHLN
ncbi:MAG: hypothetical protein V3R81_09385 [Gammaproteobacteria bacterium]